MTFGTVLTPLATAEEALSLIPQRPPFVVVDTLISATGSVFLSSFHVPDEHVLVHQGALLEAGLMENAAQTAAMGMGWAAKLAGSLPPLGFIGALSKVEIYGDARCGDRITTNVSVRHEVMNARVLDAEVRCDRTLLARLELKVFIIDTPNAA